MKQPRISFYLFKNIEYDATEGKDLFRVSCLSEWLEKEALLDLLRNVEIGVFTADLVTPKSEPTRGAE